MSINEGSLGMLREIFQDISMVASWGEVDLKARGAREIYIVYPKCCLVLRSEIEWFQVGEWAQQTFWPHHLGKKNQRNDGR